MKIRKDLHIFFPDADEIEHRPVPALARIATPLLAVMVSAVLIWACVFEVDQTVVARGRLVTEAPTIIVQPLETAIVRTLHVQVGQTVRQGDVLATLDPTFVASDVEQLRGRYAALNAEVRRLEAEWRGDADFLDELSEGQLQTTLFSLRREWKKLREHGFEESIAKAKAAHDASRREQEICDSGWTHLARSRGCGRNLARLEAGSRLRVLEAQSQTLDVEGSLSAAENREKEAAGQTAILQSDRLAFLLEYRNKIAEALLVARRDRHSAKEELAKAERRKDLISITAPADAIVLEVGNVSVGSVVRQAEKLFSLVPLDTSLLAEVRLAANDIGFTKTGQRAALKFDAFPFQRHGTLPASVRSVSHNSFLPGTSASDAQAFYVVRLALESSGLRNVAPDFQLIPGLTLSADINVGRRSVISYLTWPILNALDNSLGEP